MIDFIEYVVAELKSKRLSRTNAAALVREFARRAPGPAADAAIHPLLHRNTSDLAEQRYSSRFTGEEFFLADHQVQAGGQPSLKVLPGVAYLEMARAAIEQATPERPDPARLELRNVVWAQPIVVAEPREVNIALLADENEQVDFEVYGDDSGEEVVHCQGRAVPSREPAPARLDLAQLRAQMTQGSLQPEALYAACARMGLLYGTGFQSVAALHRGSGQLLAELRLPAAVADEASAYVLHPSLMDGALQAAVGLVEIDAESVQPRLPFALETLRILAPCTAAMVAWVRYSEGNQNGALVRLDIDLCDARGNVCVQMRGFAWRTLSSEIGAAPRTTAGSLIAVPVWQAASIASPGAARDFLVHRVMLCGLPQIESEAVESRVDGCRCRPLTEERQAALAQRYSDCALACFETIQSILRAKPQGKVLFQLAIADDAESSLLAGLSGLLRTAAIENPQFTGQVIVVPAAIAVEELCARLEDEKNRGIEPLIRIRDGAREALRWQELATEAVKPAFRDDGVYLVTGGLGAIGRHCAREILAQTRDARVVLTGRAAWTDETRVVLDESFGNERVSYQQLDLGDLDDVERVVAAIRAEHGQLTGILHCAGMTADDFILNKTAEQFRAVLAPKVAGTVNLDQATRDAALDFFVLFAAVAGAMGNLGQADYAAANGFLDQFAAYRNRQVAAGRRHGRTLSIDWPLWREGGMGVDDAARERLRQTAGMQPMETATGIAALHRCLAQAHDQFHDQMLVVEGDLAQVRRSLLSAPEAPAEPRMEVPAAAKLDADELVEKTQDYLRRQLSGLLKLPASQIDPRAAMENYGIDSILAMKLTNQMEASFGSLSKTLFFEYRTIRELAGYFIANHAAQLNALLSPGPDRPGEPAATPVSQAVVAAAPAKVVSSRRFRRRRSAAPAALPSTQADPIAIIGLSGRYPEAVDIAAYWNNLRDGKDCIGEVPRERWNWREYLSEDRGESGRHYSKWGGFITGVDEFDPLFFNISPVDAELIDPQERLFLQHAWTAIEDAGYTRAGLQVSSGNDLPGQVGVYVGVMYTEYQIFGAEASARGQRLGVPGSAASIANRVSYAFNLHGPSMTLDSMCSSSLTAIHLACEDLKHGRTSMAIAGGVNVSIHPNKYLVLSAGQFISGDGHCQSFGEGGDGYIPGEGVGVVVLKRLSEAERDGDHIYGVIRGSALNHGGKTNGYSVPNPQAQTSAISRALAESKIDARHVSYIEAHGTGTKLGDPIEIAALSKAFRPYTEETGFCLIGSAKSNIGHCESAAGIAGLTKVLLQMQHRQIVPSLHSAQLNPHIDFDKTPFIVNQTLRPWEPPVVDGRTLPRIAGISSFGAGGSNAHVIIEEYVPPVRQAIASGQAAVVLSARTPGQLEQQVRDLLAFVRPRVSSIDLASLAYTLQVGREPMEERLALLVSSTEQLVASLEAYARGERSLDDVHQGQVKRNNETLSLFSTDSDLRQAVDRWLVNRKLGKLVELWVKGLEVDWTRLHGEARPSRVSLPTYPFARERYWIDLTVLGQATAGQVTATAPAAVAVLHPLLHSNTSDLSEQRYTSTFTGEELFLADHQVAPDGQAAEKVLPAVAYLEMARAAVAQALPARDASPVIELRNTVWAQPIVVRGAAQVNITLLPGDDDQIEYEVYSQLADEEIVHCQGRVLLGAEPAPARVDLAQLAGELPDRSLSPDALYAACERMGLRYGPSFRAITSIERGSRQLLARLRLPEVAGTGGFVLHPSLMDGSLQAAVGLLEGDLQSAQPRLPFALETLRVFAPCVAEMAAWVRLAPGSQPADAVLKLDIDLCDEQGNVCAQMRGLSARALSVNLLQTAGSLLAAPAWAAAPIAAASAGYAEHHVVLCELPHVALPALDADSLHADPSTGIARLYNDYAVACFERIQIILRSKRRGKVLFQIVVPGDQERALLAGLSALLKTATLENPQFVGQLIVVSADIAAADLERLLRDEQRGGEVFVRYELGVRQVVRWDEIPGGVADAPVALQDRGVYLITGGTGALGLLFAREILAQTGEARVVLTGRSELTAGKQALVDTLGYPGRVSYRQVDLSDLAGVERAIAAVAEEHGALTGILHSAGIIADGFILNKTSAQFREVLAPKVTGTVNLDHATRHAALDFFVLFSSIAGAAGNLGQADYAAANGFVDQFAAHRNRQVAAGERRGRTRSINWPLWQSGGMGVDAERRELLQQSTGMQPMQTATGMAAFHRSLALPHDQLLVVEGDLARIRRSLLAEAAQPAEAVEAPAVEATLDSATLAEQTQEYLRKELSGLLKMPSHKIDPQAALEEYGIDSILAMKLTNRLEKTFGSLSKTLFFEYQTIEALAGYFIGQHAAQLTALLAPPVERRAEVVLSPATPAPSAPKLTSSRRFQRVRSAAAAPAPEADPIAIIGLSGRYPEALDLEAYWENLREGKDCITEVPKERWDWREYFSEDRAESGRHFSKWGGFMAGVDEFDPLFFNISPAEAEFIDPQERLFLQHAWMAVEDAGYTRAGLQVPQENDLANQVGVYAGVMYSEYQLFGAGASALGRHMALPGSTASIANRVSYAFNLHGPSVTFDTMCSSSLTAIHFACQDLRSGRTSLAVAGGVNVSIHPNKYLLLSAGQFISGDGHCQSFGEGGDGYIPGEGVGVVVLKRLSEAERDGDHIYGVIRGSALNHGGKTNGYSVPNPQAQASAISRALAESKIDARHVSYIEAHGTGTKLGDPIEIAALSKAFRPYTEETGFCLIGSAKSNIGHCESAAGIAGLTKVLLQMQHRQIVPSLHSAQLNPHIDFDKTPFIVNQTLRPWEPPVVDGRTLPRIAGISSFGAGGSNAHVIVEEYQAPAQPAVNMEKGAILLSARTPEQLEQKVRDLLAFVRARVSSIDLASLAYTLQVGRESMDVRLALIAASVEELVDKLQAFAGGERAIEDLYQGQITRSSDGLSAFSTDADLRQTVDKWLAGRKLAKLIDLWVKGLEIDWSKLYGEARPRRSTLPAYPFARERHWIDTTVAERASTKAVAAAVLHPLLHSNTSDLSEQRFRSTFTGEEFFLADHQVRVDGTAQKMLPAVAQLEMARAAVEHALPEAASLELRNVVWARPIVVSQPTEVSIALDAEDDEAVSFEIFGEDGDVHCQGRAVLSRQAAPATLDLAQLRTEMAQGQLEPESVYAACSRMGLIYGASFQGITALHRGTGQVLAQLQLPQEIAGSAKDFVLHPSLMDGALQACVGLLDAVSSQPRVPFALETLRIITPCTAEMLAWVRVADGSRIDDSVVKLDIDVCDERGNVCAQLRGLSSRALGSDAVVREGRAAGTLLAVPVWQAVAAQSGAARQLAEHHVIACDLDVTLPAARCIALQSDPQATIADRYSELALAAFEQIQTIVTSRPRGNVLVQVVVAEQALAGLSALLKTAALENPQLSGQLIIASPDLPAEELGRRLSQETRGALDPLVRLEQDGRTVLRWQEVAADPRKPAGAFKDDGVYLITGGTGGLGLLFAKEILEHAHSAHVVLTGRAPLTAETHARLDPLGAHTARASYRQLDLGDLEQVTRLVADLRAEHGRLDGVLHSAGMVSDHLIPNKTRAEFGAVLAPKVAGAFHLDLATRDVELDIFVLFSSVAGAAGNYGQADYAAANGFMDQFAAERNRLVAAGERHGRTRSINWPLWRDGGMGTDPAGRELLQQATGMRPMETAVGMDAFHRSLALPHDQLLVVEGDLTQIRRALLAGPEAATAPQVSTPLSTSLPEAGSASMQEKTQDFLRQEFAPLLKLPAQKIDPLAALEKYGIDSILAVRLTNQLEKSFGSLPKTLFFEYQTIAALAGYFVRSHAAALREKLDLQRDEREAPQAAPERRETAPVRRSKKRFRGASAVEPREIAIVGLAGRYPQANDLREFWRNLQAGRDSITEIPLERWDHARFFDPDPNQAGKSYSKWGGFISDVDKFDPLFFGISPKEAELIDPQERLFLETAWETIEDAGYTKESISGSRVGVFVGVMWSQYELFGAESVLRGETSLPGSSHASIANRVSYYFDFRGPSIALDTMCSSSLTAIHLACEELRRGEIDAALAGGVNVSIHPYKYLSLSQGKFAATDGRCRSFGAGGDGYVPGEGVGAVLLKPLEHALRDGDQIYAVIKSSSVNHGGKTNGYTVPNPNAQGELIHAALKKADVDPKTLGYIEAHGTGTSLGDPIEIAGLLQAFEHPADAKPFCPIGSVKSNIGHLESAAGIAAVTKTLLQIRHKQLVPSLHADTLNPNIDFAASPFYVQKELAGWEHSGPHPRRAGVSSFGAGGANAHIILEEYQASETATQAGSREAFVLSARDEAALRRYAGRVIAFLEETAVPLAALAYTSQVGRTPMDARLVVLASSVAELREKLSQWADGATDVDDLYHGNLREAEVSAGNLMVGAPGKAFLEALLVARDLDKIARLWVLGAEVDWSLMHRQARAKRVSLPTYPFARERYWVPQDVSAPAFRAIEPARRTTWYGPQWTPQALGAPQAAAHAGSMMPALLLDSSDDLFLALREQGHAVVLVRPGTSFAEVSPDVYTVDPRREEQFRELLAVLASRDFHPGVVLHHEAEGCELEVGEAVAQQLHRGLYALFHLCRALMSERQPLRIVSLFDGQSPSAPLSVALGGFLKTLSLEEPRVTAKVIDVAGISAAQKAHLLTEEIGEDRWSALEIRYRGGARSVRRLVPQSAAPQSAVPQRPLPLRQNGVYLITGGIGGLGSIFAEYLARTFQARLILVGRSAPDATQQAKLEQLRALGAEVLVLQADVTKADQIAEAVREATGRFSQIHGVIHAAGVNRDAFILRKTAQEIETVLAAKVAGTINLELATRGESLDFFVLFSSLAGVLGNVGQSDYAYANAFEDAFAARREELREAQQRSGRTLSINWPLWQEGGMGLSRDDLALLDQRTGMSPLPTPDGIRCFEEFLRSEASQCIALYGISSKIAGFIEHEPAAPPRRATVSVKGIEANALAARTEAYLKTLVGEEIKLAADRIGSTDPLESFGIDSVAINRINARLERDLGALPKTLLYEHETVRALAAYLLRQSREALVGLFGADERAAAPALPAVVEEEAVVREVAPAAQSDGLDGAVAIIGIHGIYPQSTTHDELWNNLRDGKHLIDVVPRGRWDAEELFHPDPAAASEGKIYCKWGGFLEDYDKFDPHFFKISTAEAKMLDPQERMFLQSVWAAIEDAGYTRERLRTRFPKAGSADVGVFVGVTTNTYHLWAPEERMRGNAVAPTAMPWSIANRVSYYFDFNGPSLPVDTACSSSLVAIHLACESLRNGECQVAIAGGVNLYLHPAKYHSLCQKRMVSLDGKCHSYGAGDDGFVPGEGVGSLVLKPLARAIADGDRIHAVIRASAHDHSGRSNGYSAPNPNAQAALISRTLKKAGIHPETIGYVEGHGTGTQLGDSIEIAALTQAFEKETARRQFCPIGSVKANMGHSESAAGIAGLAKVILQMQHGQLVPSIHSDEVNPNIEFQQSPFYLQHGLAEWPASPAHPRRALINSFGAGGVNACLVVEELSAAATPVSRESGPYLLTLSARNEERLRDYAGRLLAHLRNEPSVDLAGLCYSLQTGREAMEERLAVVVHDMPELIDRLDSWTYGNAASGIHRGSLGPRRGPKRPVKLATTNMGEQQLIELAARWAAGEEMEWETLHALPRPRRVSAPTYPFARERYWVTDGQFSAVERIVPAAAQLHPLISYNSSTLKEVSFTSSLSDTAFYAVDHQVGGERIFPGAGFLEMACIAANIASEQRVRKIKDIVWMRPLSFRAGAQSLRTELRRTSDGGVEYAISSVDDHNESVVHSEGRVAFGSGHLVETEDPMPPQALKALCTSPEAGAGYYERFRANGLHYGPAFQTIQELYVNHTFVMARLKIAESLKGEFGQFILHPSIIDGALQTIAGLVGSAEARTPYLPFALDELEVIKPLSQTCYAYAEWADPHTQNRAGVTKFNIRLLNPNGEVLVKFKNLYVRPLAKPQPAGHDAGAQPVKGRLLSLSGGPIE